MRGGKGNTGKIESRMTIGSASAASLDIELLAQELAKLRVVLKENATLPEQDLAIAQVSKAFLDAEKGDNSGAVKSLAGLSTLAAHLMKWVLDTATAIGIPVAVAALKLALHLPAAG